MYLLDTNVISELRKTTRANSGVIRFFEESSEKEEQLFLSAVTIGEIRRGVDRIQYRGDKLQAEKLEAWLQTVVIDYADNILNFSRTEAQVWGKLRVPHAENAIDKQIAATALTHDLTLVTRNIKDFKSTGVILLNPFE
ncbi:MAG: type II toxin-antitoxin system VapC family toxin [Phormidesmis sp.]